MILYLLGYKFTCIVLSGVRSSEFSRKPALKLVNTTSLSPELADLNFVFWVTVIY